MKRKILFSIFALLFTCPTLAHKQHVHRCFDREQFRFLKLNPGCDWPIMKDQMELGSYAPGNDAWLPRLHPTALDAQHAAKQDTARGSLLGVGVGKELRRRPWSNSWSFQLTYMYRWSNIVAFPVIDFVLLRTSAVDPYFRTEWFLTGGIRFSVPLPRGLSLFVQGGGGSYSHTLALYHLYVVVGAEVQLSSRIDLHLSVRETWFYHDLAPIGLVGVDFALGD